MSAIARLFLAKGFAVSGSDVKESANVEALRGLGAQISLRHCAANIDGAIAVVISSAIGDGNPEVREARRRGVAVLGRGAALNMLMDGKTGVVIAGTAGKSSTSAMLAKVMRHCGVDASYAIGAKIHDSGTNAVLGAGAIFIAEADESDNSFLLLSPDVALITNVESDHLDFHGTTEKYRQAFERFVDRVSQGGLLVVSADDPGARKIGKYARGRLRVKTFGEAEDSDLRITDIRIDRKGAVYRVLTDSIPDLEVRIKQPGRHMIRNSAGAMLAALELGLPAESVVEALEEYKGIGRRFEMIGCERAVCVYDDFAHSPTKIREQLDAAKILANGAKLWSIFEAPRVKGEGSLVVDFTSALDQADEVLLLDESAALDAIPGGAGANKPLWLTDFIVREFKSSGRDVRVCPGRADVVAAVCREAQAGDVVVTMGLRDLSGLGAEIIRGLRKPSASG